jgi:predicted NAD/FAD-binding protein
MPSETRFNFKNGVSTWIGNLVKTLPAQNIIQSETPKIARTENGFAIRYAEEVLLVDKVVFACHADDLCQHYADVLSEQQHRILSTVKYANMLSIAHCDIKYLPVDSTDFSAYNCLVKDASDDKNTDYTITYNCNEHQNLSNGGNNFEGAADYFFVTVNPTQKIDDQYILRDTDGHPLIKEFSRNVCDFDLLQAQEQLKGEQGKNSVYFVGGYTNGIGLHENCLVQSAGIAKKIASAFQIRSKPFNDQQGCKAETITSCRKKILRAPATRLNQTGRVAADPGKPASPGVGTVEL